MQEGVLAQTRLTDVFVVTTNKQLFFNKWTWVTEVSCDNPDRYSKALNILTGFRKLGKASNTDRHLEDLEQQAIESHMKFVKDSLALKALGRLGKDSLNLTDEEIELILERRNKVLNQ